MKSHSVVEKLCCVKIWHVVRLPVPSKVAGHQKSSHVISGWPAGRHNVVLLLSKPFDVLFQCTLERPLCHINQGCSECHAVFSVNPKASAYTGNDLLGKKAAIFEAGAFRQTSPADVT